MSTKHPPTDMDTFHMRISKREKERPDMGNNKLRQRFRSRPWGLMREPLCSCCYISTQVIYLDPVVDNSSKVTGDAPSATGVPTLTDDRRLRLRWRMRFRRQLHKKCGWLVVGDCGEAGSAIWSDGGHRRWEIELVGMRDRDVGEEELLREGKNSGD
jgi:hypothetical protein